MIAFARSDTIRRSVYIACISSIPRWYLGRCFVGQKVPGEEKNESTRMARSVGLLRLNYIK